MFFSELVSYELSHNCHGTEYGYRSRATVVSIDATLAGRTKSSTRKDFLLF